MLISKLILPCVRINLPKLNDVTGSCTCKQQQNVIFSVFVECNYNTKTHLDWSFRFCTKLVFQSISQYDVTIPLCPCNISVN